MFKHNNVLLNLIIVAES